MFESVQTEIYERIRQCNTLLRHIKSLEEADDSSLDYLIKIQKGSLFVSLYSVIEYTVVNTCQHFLTHLSFLTHKPSSYKNNIMCIILHSKFEATLNTGKSRWLKKRDLIDAAFGENTAQIVNTVFPTDGSNIAYNQLSDIWDFFCVPDPILPEGMTTFLLTEIKDNRNAIAHGRKTASEVGGRYSYDDLERKFRAVEKLSLHIYNQFVNHASNETYLKQSA